jgi:hypothetical protein
MALIGTASLWRSYRTTVRLYTGHFTARKRRAPAPAAPVARPATVKLSAGLLETKVPWLSEQTSAVALAGLRSFLRAPEAKMMLLSPVVMVLVFGMIFLRQASNPAETTRALMAFGAMAMVLFTLVQFVGNQFGFDRSGFRVFVLSPAPRRDILLGKNLAAAPLVLTLCLATAALIEVVYPLRWDHLLVLLPQWVIMYLVFCLLANLLSLLAPMAIAAGTMKPANPKGLLILLQIVFMFVLPVALLPALLPLGVELLLEAHGWDLGLPVGLIVALVECVAVVFLYRLVLGWQGQLLQAREQRILELVTTKEE